jgi:hypothetical protein
MPSRLGIAGRNLICPAPIADAGPYAITLDVVRNAPIPAVDGDYVQIGREEVEAIIDYAQHLAEFKQGSYELQASAEGWNGLVKMAALKNSRLAASTKLMNEMLGRATEEEVKRPRKTVEATEQANA